MNISPPSNFNLYMPTKPVNISLNENLVGPITKDKGPASMSGFINYIMEIFYSQPLHGELEKFRKKEGLKENMFRTPEKSSAILFVSFKFSSNLILMKK